MVDASTTAAPPPPGYSALSTLFQQVVAEQRPVLLRALQPLLDPAQAEDVVQEAALRVYQTLDTLEAEYLTAYWFRTARNLALSRLRHEKVCQRAAPMLAIEAMLRGGQTDADDQYDSHREKALLVNAINTLPPMCRNVLIARKIEGRTQREIASEMAISVNTVQNHLTQGMKLIRQYVQRHGPAKALVSPPSRADLKSGASR